MDDTVSMGDVVVWSGEVCDVETKDDGLEGP
jgi:hypothetical protein